MFLMKLYRDIQSVLLALLIYTVSVKRLCVNAFWDEHVRTAVQFVSLSLSPMVDRPSTYGFGDFPWHSRCSEMFNPKRRVLFRTCRKD